MTDEPSVDPADEAPPTEAQPPPPDAPPTVPLERRRLRRSRDDRVIAGVCGGLGEYLGVEPVLIRIAAVALVFLGGAGIVLYIVGWIAIPEEPAADDVTTESGEPATAPARTSGAVVLGLLFVVLGALFLLDEIWPDLFSWKYVWPVALIAVGAAILVRATR